MIIYDKSEIREACNIEDIYELLNEWGGEPELTAFGLISRTICHNDPLTSSPSRKLYFYKNSNLFQCFTGCDSFDIFELVIKVAKIQWHKEFDLNDAIRWIAHRFNIAGEFYEEDELKQLPDWKILDQYDKLHEVKYKLQEVKLKEYDDEILSRFNYNLVIQPWIDEGITQEVINKARIGYYPGGDQITIPHFDKDGRLIGLRGRTLCQEEGEMYGKYRPLKIEQQLYNHALGMNLYGLNWSKDNIATMGKAIIFESEKSNLQYASYFGWDNNISVACCGSNISAFQIQMLLDCGAKEIIIAFDRQFKEKGDEEFQHLKKNLLKIRDRYKNFVTISFIFDKNMITGYKSSPIDEGPDKFLKLFKERIIL